MVERSVVNRLGVGSSPTVPAQCFVGVVQAASTPASQADNTGSIPVTDTNLGSPCWASMQLIPAIVMVRFHRLLLLASNRGSPTRIRISVRVRYAPLLRGVAAGAALFLPRKDESQFAASSLGRGKFSLARFFRCACAATGFFALNARSPTRNNLVRLQNHPRYGWSPVAGTFPVKERPSGLVATTLERGKNFPRCFW